jgi:hypothetical protein
MSKENEITQCQKLSQLLEWLEDVNLIGNSDLQATVSDFFEAWLSSDYASDQQKRGFYLQNSKFLNKGLKIINSLNESDFNILKRISRADKN